MKLYFCLVFLGLLTATYAQGIQVWQTFPFMKEVPNAEPGNRAMMPAGKALVQMADDEYETVALTLQNQTNQTLEYTINTGDLNKACPGLEIEILSSWVTPIWQADPKQAPLTVMGAGDGYNHPHETGDPLLPVTTNRSLYCPANQVRTSYLILHAKDAKPGIYKVPVLFRAVDQKKVIAECELTVQIWPFTVPERLDIICYHWDYGKSKDAIINMREHKVNTFMVSPFTAIDIAPDGTVSGDAGASLINLKREVVPDAKFIGSYGLFKAFYDWAQENNVKYMSPKFKETFINVIRHVVKQWKAAGLTYDDFWIQHQDEAHGEWVDRVVEMGNIAKEADPKVRWYLSQMNPLDDIKKMAPYTQLMGKRGEGTWSKDEAEWYDQYKKDGNMVIQFKQKGMYRGEPDVHRWNRLRPWRSWINRWDGMATFCYFTCPYYPNAKPVTVRQWEAIREGNEDYCYFMLARDLAAKQGKKKEVIDRIDHYVTRLIGPTAPATGMVYTPEHSVIMLEPYLVKAALAKEICSLKEGLGEQVPAIDNNIQFQPPWLSRKALKGKVVFQKSKLQNTVSQPDEDTPADQVIPLTVKGKNGQGKMVQLIAEGQWTIDNYYVAVKGILENGKQYKISFDYLWPKNKEPGAVDIGDFAHWPIKVGRGNDWQTFSKEFTVKNAAVKDFTLTLKEFRLMRGKGIEEQYLVKNLQLERLEPGIDFGQVKTTRTNHSDATKNNKKSDLRESQTDAIKTKLYGGNRYQVSIKFKSNGIIQRGVRIYNADKPIKKNDDWAPNIILLDSLPDTNGKWQEYARLFELTADANIVIEIGPQAYQQDKVVFDAKDLQIQWIDTKPLTDMRKQLTNHISQLEKQTAKFANQADPVVKTLKQVNTTWNKAKADVDNATPENSAELLKKMNSLNKQLNKIPFAVWLADTASKPLPETAIASGVSYGVSSPVLPDYKGEKQVPVILGKGAIGIANFTDQPLCYMVTAPVQVNKRAKKQKELGVSLGVIGLNNNKQALKICKPDQFIERFNWFEMVVPAGQTRYLVVDEPGEIELYSMNKQIPNLFFNAKDVKNTIDSLEDNLLND